MSVAGPVRVLMTADAVGGVWTYAEELARALSRSGCMILIAVMGGSLPDRRRRALSTLPGVRVIHGSYALEWMDDPWDDVARAGDWLLGLERRFRPDVVHLNGYCHAALPWRVPVVVVGHSCVLSWHAAVRGAPAPVERWDAYRQRVRAGLRAADLVVAPTRAMLDALEAHYGPLGRTRVIHNGRSVRAAGGAEPLVLAAGRVWDEAKNLATLSRVAPRCPWPIEVAGPERAPGAGDAVRLPGVRQLGALSPSELRRRMARAAIFAAPARYEPFGLCALEAARCGCALVLGDIASQRELWDGAACFVPPGDPAALERTLRTVIAEEDLRVSLVQRARDRARRYGAAAMGAGYHACYRELIAGRRHAVRA